MIWADLCWLLVFVTFSNVMCKYHIKNVYKINYHLHTHKCPKMSKNVKITYKFIHQITKRRNFILLPACFVKRKARSTYFHENIVSCISRGVEGRKIRCCKVIFLLRLECFLSVIRTRSQLLLRNFSLES